MYLIGSAALAALLPECKIEPKDYDLICKEDEYYRLKNFLGNKLIHEKETKRGFALFVQGSKPIELEIAYRGANTSSNMLIDILDEYTDSWSITPLIKSHAIFEHEYIKHASVANFELLYALKMSHRYLKNSVHFRKTMDHIILLREFRGGKEKDIHPILQNWYKLRMKETYDYSHPKLNQTKSDFFSDDGVNYIYDHDSIHEAVKTFDRPAFEYIKHDAADVLCSKEKFMEASEDIKLATVLEESYVLALERCLIPFYLNSAGWDTDYFKDMPKKAFLMALEKVCTSIASGWWREYAWESYYKVLDKYTPTYVNKFQSALSDGRILPYKEKVA